MPVEIYVWWDCDTRKALCCYVPEIRYLKSKRKIITGYVLIWAGKWKWWSQMYIYIWEPLSVQLPEKCNCLEIGTWDQLWDNKWRPRINILSDKIHLSYYHIKIWSCDTIVCLFGVRNTGQVIWISNKVNDPTMSGVVLVLMLVRSFLAWSRLWSKHEIVQQSWAMNWRASYRQVQSVWESSDARVNVKHLLGHTSLFFNRGFYELYMIW